MIDERAYELLTSQLGIANEEKAALRKQLELLTAEFGNMSSSHKEEVDTLKENIAALKESVDGLNVTVGIQTRIIESRDTAIEALNLRIKELLDENKRLEDQVKNGRKHRFARSSEQARLLNNREVDTVAQGKADFDGTSANDDKDAEDKEGNSNGSSCASSGKHKVSAKAGKKARSPKKQIKVDKTIIHEVDSYYDLPEGARFIYRNGEMDVTNYRVIEYIKAHTIEHIYKVARVQNKDGSFTNTMTHPLGALGGVFSPTLLAQTLGWKYAYHLPLERIRKLLADEGVQISKSTLNKYIQDGMSRIRMFIETPFREAVQGTDYLMVDETVEVVGVENEETENRSYMKKYLWAFYAKYKKMVYYLYDKGSRARKVVENFLKDFKGAISTDGYVAYQIFNDEKKYPLIIHISCWTHARRLFIEALESDRRAMEIIKLIAELFALEDTYKRLDLNPDQVEKRRMKDFIVIFKKINKLLKKFKNDVSLMANSLMAKAVNYMINQWKTLENVLRCGRAEISNNLAEQRMKAVKLNLKNCQNIGSEEAAKNAAFMLSLTESCSLNGINAIDYLKHLLECIRDNSKQDKTQLLPCFYKGKC